MGFILPGTVSNYQAKNKAIIIVLRWLTSLGKKCFIPISRLLIFSFEEVLILVLGRKEIKLTLSFSKW